MDCVWCYARTFPLRRNRSRARAHARRLFRITSTRTARPAATTLDVPQVTYSFDVARRRRRTETLRLVPRCARRYVRERVRQAYRSVAAGGRHFTLRHGETRVAAGFEFIVKAVRILTDPAAAEPRPIVAGVALRSASERPGAKSITFPFEKAAKCQPPKWASLQQAPCKPKKGEHASLPPIPSSEVN